MTISSGILVSDILNVQTCEVKIYIITRSYLQYT
jgi:hypothetical protein